MQTLLPFAYNQKPEVIQPKEELPKLRKVEKKVEEPKKEEVKRAKVKISKPKKYEELPEIPDYERAELEKYEESEFELGKSEKAVPTPGKVSDQGVESTAASLEPKKNGLAKVMLDFKLCFVVIHWREQHFNKITVNKIYFPIPHRHFRHYKLQTDFVEGTSTYWRRK